MQTEPIRVTLYIAALFVSVGGFFIDWAQGGDWRIAVGQALGAFAVIAFGAELGRSNVYSPQTHEREVAQAKQDGMEVGATGAQPFGVSSAETRHEQKTFGKGIEGGYGTLEYLAIAALVLIIIVLVLSLLGVGSLQQLGG